MCYCAYEFLLIFVRVFLTAAGRRTGELATLPGSRIIYSYHKRRRGGGSEGNITQPSLHLPLLRRLMSSSGKRVVTMVKYTKTKAPKFRQTAVWSSYTMLGGAIVVCRNLGALVISIILVISHHGEGLVVMV
jgi:hypothetical protein